MKRRVVRDVTGRADPERLRLAVAIAVLRSKPRDISLPSYILSLHAHFPPSGPAPPTADYRWKTYALKLESDLEQLKEKYAAQKTELLALSSNGSSEFSFDSASLEGSVTLSTPTDAIKKKAKSKKTPGASDVKTAPDLDIFHQNDYQIPRSGDLLLALRAFGKVISGSNDDASTLLHSTLRIIQIASRILTPIIDQPSSKTSNSVTVSVLGKILSHTIRTSLPSIKVQRQSLVLSDIDKVFDSLIKCIFGPIILAFTRITHASLSTLLGESSSGSGSPPNLEKPSLVFDLRQDLLRLFKVLVDDLHSASLSAHKRDPLKLCQWTISLTSLKACLNLEIVRELGKVLFPVAKPSAANGSDTELGNELWNQGAHAVSRAVPSMVPASASLASSVASVVAKDVLWYLCSLMHILADLPEGYKLDSEVFPPGAPQDSHPPPRPDLDQHENETALLELLHDTVLSSLYDLVLRCQSVIDYGERPRSESDTVDGMHRSDKTQVGNSLTVYRHHSRREGGLSSGDKESAQNSQAQGHLSFPGDHQSEVGDPCGFGLRDRLDDISCIALAAEYDTDFRFRNSHQTAADGAANSTAEVDVPPVDVSGDCVIDEAGFTMLLGVVERFILGSGYMR
ncbi:hypothetical protein AGABI1DRAFT_123708 [Agaricus bisporus var. burnettii JB137-S8]|uniref:Uncharacterized protein n=1 Tax=Agaricus bisporus var. burnettii (strain JB137-S8 / ATCC MYA-4627 / FGSC 10392) TaxID=597362 RepID=K5W938_AGABU|nr:uncharacterized protein AGABI1DRAFT_123708 [Agaricus bisporus var. burnettii JB137-S8]EKM83374.1 hypothetical protein AGABI1DRAFT_123708 [Agaricus bisporus var. burnettii JB137-S8]